MAKGKRNRKRGGSMPAGRNAEKVAGARPAAPRVDDAADPVLPDRVSTGQFAGGLACLAVAVAATFILVLSHIAGLSIPGCGAGGGCAEAAASAWGRVPGIGDEGWPVSFLGFAYFSGLLIAWLAARGGVPALLRYLVRFGVLISLMFIVVLIVQRHLCYYCLATHAANLAFWILLERVRVRPASPLRLPAAVTLVFLLVSGVLYGVETRERKAFRAKQETEREESVARIIESDRQKAVAAEAAEAAPPPPVAMAPSGQTATPEPPAAPDAAAPIADASAPVPGPVPPPESQGEEPRPWKGGFTGRYRLGPEKASIRIVMITDYQCRDCQRLEPQVMRYVEQHDSISLSIKHFPMCGDCNPHFRGRNVHPNACWAAYAAEAAGILGGNDGFWQMHRWLFAHKGSFTNEVLRQGLLDLGFEEQEFKQVMAGPEVRQRVQSDIREAVWLGLHYTPMMFINGVELKGVFVHNAIPRTLDQLLEENPAPLTAEWDQPPPAIEKCVADWQAQYVRRHAPDHQRWPRGPDDARLKIVMWGDFQEKYTAIADRAILAWMAGKPDVRYTFRHFPFNQDCNPVVSVNRHPMACLASQAAEAAGLLAGIDGYWKMHDWLMTHQDGLNPDRLRQAAVEMGFDPTALFSAMEDQQVADAIEADCRAAKSTPQTTMAASFLYRAAIPTIYINEKVVPRWRLQERVIVDRLLDVAYAE